MAKIIGAVVGLAMVAVLVTMAPDLKRYLKLRSM